MPPIMKIKEMTTDVTRPPDVDTLGTVTYNIGAMKSLEMKLDLWNIIKEKLDKLSDDGR